MPGPSVVTPQGQKYCPQCDQLVAVDDFYDDRRSHTGLSSWCKPCTRRNVNIAWRGRDPGRRKQMAAIQKLRYRYGLTEEAIAALPSECEICGSSTDLAVDHDHVSGLYRGRLCRTCNSGLGMFKDDADRLLGALVYLLERSS